MVNIFNTTVMYGLPLTFWKKKTKKHKLAIESSITDLVNQ